MSALLPTDSPAPDGTTPDSPAPDSPTLDGPTLDSPTLDGPAPNGPAPNGPAPNGPALRAPEPDRPFEYTGPLVDLGMFKEALRRGRKLWLAGGLLGLLIGASMHFLVPAKYAATTDLYMAEPATEDASTAIANDVSLLGTRAVAQRAIDALHIRANAERFSSTYQALALSDVIIQIRISAPTAAKADAYDSAVAKAFLAVRSQELAFQTNTMVDDLNAQVASLTANENGLTDAIDTLSTGKAGPQTADQLQQLVNERSDDASQTSQLETEEQQDLLDERASIQGSRVLDPAVISRVSGTKVLAEDGLSGLVAGLGLCLGGLLIAAAISDRPRRRNEIAALLEVPIELSVGRYRSPRFLRRWRPRRQLPGQQEPAGLLRRRSRHSQHMSLLVERRLRACLPASPKRALAVVVIGPPDLAALGLASLALSLASEGRHVLVLDAVDHHPLVPLLAPTGTEADGGTLAVSDGSVTLAVIPDGTGPVGATVPLVETTDTLLALTYVSPSTGADHLTKWAQDAVVVVTAGAATTARLSTTTLLLRAAGVAVRSAVLVGSTPHDDSPGICPGASSWPVHVDQVCSHEHLDDRLVSRTASGP